MILTCPDCATSYFVEDERIPAAGRTVKCSSCGARWTARPEGEEPLEIEAEIMDEVAAPAVAAAPLEPPTLTEPEPLAAEDDLEFVAAPPRAVRRAPAPKPKPRAPVAAIGAVAAVLVGLAAAILFRQQVVEVAPAVAPAYAAVGLPVDGLGLVIEQVKSQAVLDGGGRPALSVTGAIRNTRGEPVMAPPMRISLLDKAGKPIAGKLAQPLNAKIPPGGKRYFAVAIPDPPAGSHELEIAFEGAAAPPQGVAAAEPAPGAAAHAPEPVEATPLPPGSPDALQDHG